MIENTKAFSPVPQRSIWVSLEAGFIRSVAGADGIGTGEATAWSDPASAFACRMLASARFLRNEPVTAKPPSPLYIIGKFAKRHQTGFRTVCGFVILLVAATVFSIELTKLSVVDQEYLEGIDRPSSHPAESAKPAATP